VNSRFSLLLYELVTCPPLETTAAGSYRSLHYTNLSELSGTLRDE
jgi:hypothetical protein